nr:MAG TPA: hypothetical protein [Caudoviricetes sp.]
MVVISLYCLSVVQKCTTKSAVAIGVQQVQFLPTASTVVAIVPHSFLIFVRPYSEMDRVKGDLI